MKTSPLLLILLAGCAGPANKVNISLPLPPKLDLSLYDHLLLLGFISSDQNREFSSEKECLNFLRRELIRKKALPLLEAPPFDLAERDPRTFFEKEQPALADLPLAEDKSRTLTLTGEVSFEVLDRSGFRQVQTTDITGNRVYQTRFVEATGYQVKLRLHVYELGKGRLLYREALQDEIDVEGPPGDTRLAFNELLHRMSQNIIGLFTPTVVRAERNLL